MPESIQKKKRKFFHRLKHTYRLVFFNDITFEEVWHVRFTLMNVLSIAGTIIMIVVGGSMALVMFTPMRELVPGYPTNAMRRQIVTNAMRLDSLEHEIHLRDRYLHAVNAIIDGREPEIAEAGADGNSASYQNITFTRSEQDSLLRKRVEEEERFNFAPRQPSVFSSSEDISISKVHFFKPVEGIVSGKFNLNNNHFGIDLVAAPNEVVKSTLDGTVVMSAWTSETGYIIEVQHTSNILSVYKHNASLLKKQGDRVKAGDAIAIVGNSGELTTGPHLHFEVWQNGTPVNPEDYIAF
ncbi:MAG: M23 family metallopeptidase [Bacteroidales bacterium]|jgi:murein DD-endopeptidase MepM/ murein hydrolase activator NlpD|nr:M23 family metallopeptidase [Bacteroidales bacterium]